MTATLYPISLNISETLRVVWLFPDPVLTAQMETTGFVDFSWDEFVPISRKSAPDAKTSDALSIT